MIIEFSVENYKSIKEKITLSLEASSSKNLPQNVIKTQKLLKTAVIYGPNASGKSNIIKAMYFLWDLVSNSHKFNVDVKIPQSPFALHSKWNNKPSRFEIIFIHEGIRYKYGFSSSDKIEEEYLYFWPKGRESLIFERKGEKYEFTKDQKRQKQIREQTNNNVLYLSRATQLGYEKTKAVYDFIIGHIVINVNRTWHDFTIRELYTNPKRRREIVDILQRADFGGITDIAVKKSTRPISGFEFKIEKGAPSVNTIEKKEEEFYDVRFLHKSDDGIIEFGIQDESDGTQRTLMLLGPFIDILETGKVAFIDEMEQSLHPNIAQFLVKLFNSKKNKKNAQLIFTAHETTLLSSNMLRRDQVFFCSKKPNEHTIVTSLLDYDVRESNDFGKIYLSGRVGALPFIDETLLE